MEQLIGILNSLKPGVDFANEKNLVEDKILDSLTMVILAGRISDEFGVKVTPLDITPENFRSCADIMAMIERLKNK
jgi:acyl carrier protein